jgi:hypothetical protein
VLLQPNYKEVTVTSSIHKPEVEPPVVQTAVMLNEALLPLAVVMRADTSAVEAVYALRGTEVPSMRGTLL